MRLSISIIEASYDQLQRAEKELQQKLQQVKSSPILPNYMKERMLLTVRKNLHLIDEEKYLRDFKAGKRLYRQPKG